MKPKDKPKKTATPVYEAPQLFAVVDDEKFPRPGLETFFADSQSAPVPAENNCSCHPVGGVYCQCNKVRVCSCVGYVGCSCNSHTSGRAGCRCAPVH